MCRLCTDDPDKYNAAVQEHLDLAKDMEILASVYRNQANGKMDPHEPSTSLALAAKRVAIELVSNW